MLPPFIIDQIRKREEDERRSDERPERRLPLPEPMRREQKPCDDEGERGVVIIDLGAE